MAPSLAQEAPADPPAPADQSGGEAPATDATDPNAEGTDGPVDPLAGEGNGETPPGSDVPVPRSGRYANQPDFAPPRILWSKVRAARSRLETAIESHVEAVNQVRSLRLREKALRSELMTLGNESRAAIAALEVAERRLRERALNAFTAADSGTASVSAIDHDDLLQARSQQFLIESVFKVDQALIEEISRLKASLDREALTAFERLNRVVETITRVDTQVDELAAEISDADRELEVFRAGSEFYVADVVFPIDGPYDLPLINSWGYPRAEGTPDEHWHEGIDIFAPEGTPIVASERGVATKVGVAPLGGIRVWVLGESGTEWYYSHMSAIAEGLEVGDVVEVGQLVGYVGHSGNAVGTPDHLHLQVHPGGSRPVNPYPILKVVADHDLAARQAQEALASDLVVGEIVVPWGAGASGGFTGFRR